MTTFFNMIKDINGVNGFGLPISTDAFSTTLAASTEQHVVAPTAAKWYLAIINADPGASVWMAVGPAGTTAAIPSTSFAATNSALNLPAIFIQGGQTLSVISPVACAVGVLFYALQL